MNPTYSVLIPWGDRPALALSLSKNRPFFERHAVETVIVNMGGRFDRLQEIVRGSGVPNVVTIDLPVVRASPESEVTWNDFSRSLCLNVGATASRGEYLFFMDEDVALRTDVFAEAQDDLMSGSRYVAVGRMYESEPTPPRTDGTDLSCFLAEVIETRELVTKDGRRAVLRERCYSGLRSSDGILLLARRHMEESGGMNSMLTGWGYEDSDFQIRLQLLLGLERVEHGEVVHLTHPSWRSATSWQRNRAICARNYCAGDFRGTLAQDTERWGSVLMTVRA
jgi:hypothetical protein